MSTAQEAFSLFLSCARITVPHTPGMATLSTTAKSPRKQVRSAPKASGSIARSSRLVVCGTNRQLTRDELMAEDAAFLSRMKGGAKATQSSVDLVREGR
jgi:hypothetical protein